MNKYKHLSNTARRERRVKRMCTDKKPYVTSEVAKRKGQDVYHCPHCGLWHRTSKVAKIINQIKRK